MKKKAKAFARAISLYDIDPQYFSSLGVKALVCDLDQTLDSPFAKTPSRQAKEFKRSLDERGIKLIILSNNFKKRVKSYAQILGVTYLPFSLKYFKFRISSFLEKQGLKPENVIFVGDQLLTDGRYTSKLNGRLILTKPLTKEDNLFTRVFRKLDNGLQKKYEQQNRLGPDISASRSKGENYVLQEKQN